ncbi:hypothetical protein PTSG_09586 [Salpingoeca rosetta]|uniref:Uncharacterized protein n=1 Tax=Salpingoeca rosetta (strain ATCC 50818 / BSB-021) TaxID=946362 RepID=F2ULF4_SALR5|nr:uncharacterized protein PTSG_09586 [Salpingoeca rosetta]EGD77953.1 hypothetical protein PTSG_09586 [Salpingoeca rosetta]|eukprot:XP_004990016.1 hypothetical protein PTSG_09586 [Salpingoeca rosetta]
MMLTMVVDGMTRRVAVAVALVVLVVSVSCPRVVVGSLQGLYAMEGGSGQLQRVDWRTGTVEKVGPSLQSKGWHVADCTPSDVDRTGKWYFALAKPVSRNDSSTPDAAQPWTLIGMLLADATIRTTQQLPDLFDPGMDACEHTVSVNSGWDAIVTAVTGKHTADPRLSVVLFNYTLATTRQTRVLVNESLAAIGLGGPAKHPATTFVTATGSLWVQLEQGLVECYLTNGSCARTLPFAPQQLLTGLQYQPSSFVYGVLVPPPSRNAAQLQTAQPAAQTHALGAFDPISMAPSITRITLSSPVTVAHGGTAMALLSDQAKVVLLTTGGDLVTAHINGTVASTVKLCSPSANVSLPACPASMVYEPFVF